MDETSTFVSFGPHTDDHAGEGDDHVVVFVADCWPISRDIDLLLFNGMVVHLRFRGF